MAHSAVQLSLRDGLSFNVDFGIDGADVLHTDAPAPLGGGTGPDSEMLLAAAVSTCLSASLVFALKKYKNEVAGLQAQAHVELAPNAQGRARVKSIAVELRLAGTAADFKFLDRALAQYQDFCTVTQSVRTSIPVVVKVLDGQGLLLA